MLRPLLRTFLLVAVLVGCAACGLLFPKKKQPAYTPHSLFIGTITLVNEAEHFVLIDNGTSPAPASGMVLKAYSGDTSSGELLASDLRRNPFIIADIRSGTPKKGDRVFYDVPKGQQPPGAPGSIPAPGTPVAPPTSPASLPDKALPPQLGLPPSFPAQ